MTDAETIAAGANGAVDLSAADPLPAEHRSIITELVADLGELSSKIAGAEAVTEASVHLQSARSALVSATQYVLAHFETLEAPAKAEVAEIEAKIGQPPSSTDAAAASAIASSSI
ncbi:hypothetical protein [Bradyrhizobium betae]|jgi:hypothetical protein|uniref:Uncharacterized protein n=1 Tax=Bradyrhizobium betae TaxID=244734 RepID=A0A5P6P968_9BRAD|nr:hypothetical protein [Bradyrhizobium betae]MCS3727291.1 hypothetical protein [Bradyrhizobium betae]QFI74806.1 hypothetical protein F8237_21785 [Bradyrhizobium betae]